MQIEAREMRVPGRGRELRVDIASGEVANLDTGKTMRAQGWPADSPPFQILMAGGLDEFMRRQVREAGLVGR